MNTDYSPSQLMNFAERGMLVKAEMADLLPEESRAEFLTACARVEKAVTDACTAHGDFCLASGCAMDGEVCLNALLNAGLDFNKACARLWLPLFRSSKHEG
jgi:hypothetical protein